MMRFTISLCLLFGMMNLVSAQQLIVNGSPKSLDHLELQKQFNDYEIFQINTQKIYDSASQNTNQFQFELNLNENLSWDLNLHENDILSPDYTTVEKGKNGKNIKQETSTKLFKGFISNASNSKVRLTLNDNFIYGFIQDENTTYYIEPINTFVKDAANDWYVVYNTQNVIPGNKSCALFEQEDRSGNLDQRIDDIPPTEEVDVLACYELDYALAADFSMFQKYGGAAGAEAHMLGVLNNVSGNYDDEFDHQILFNIVVTFISSCSSCDEWTNNTDAEILLNSFSDWGNTGGFGVTHDVGEFWTNRNLDGTTVGIAWLNGICNGGRYHVCQDYTGNAQSLRVLTAHELGHNFSARHDSGGSPFIMAPSVSNSTNWSVSSQNAINGFVAGLINSGCLSTCGVGTPPFADFEANEFEGCAPFTVSFTDISTNNPFSWNWSFPGGTPATSTNQNPTVTYNSPGDYDVTLLATNSAGSDAEVKSSYITVTETVTADFDYSLAGLTVVFNNQSVGANAFIWDFGDDGSSEAENPFYTYAEPGTYTVTLIALSDCGVSTTNQEITIALPPIAAFSSNTTEVCTGMQVNFIDESEFAVTYDWIFAGGTPETSTAQSPVVTYNSPGVYPVVLTVQNSSGSNSTSGNYFITVVESPLANFTNSISGNEVSLTNTSQNASGYSWTFGDGATSTAINPTHTYTLDGTYEISLEVTGECGTDNISQTVIIGAAPQPGFSFSGGVGCEPFVVNFTDESSSNTTDWMWQFPGGSPSTSTNQNPTITYSTPGVYDVILIASNSLGSNVSTQSDAIEVEAGIIAAFDYSFTGLDVAFEGTPNADSYLWDFGDGNSSNLPNPSHSYMEDGNYLVSLVVSGFCGPDSYEETINLTTSPTAGFSVNNGTGCSPLEVSFNNQSSNNSTSWSWSFPGGTPSTSVFENPTVIYDTPGTYSVSLIASNATGQNTITQTNVVIAAPQAEPVFTFSIDESVVTFSNTSLNATSYSWDFGDGNSSTDVNPMHTYSDGTFTAILTAFNDCGSVSTSEVITINTEPSAGFSSNVTEGCLPLTVSFNDESTVNSSSWFWSFPGGTPSSSTQQNPNVVYNTAGVYDVTLTVSSGVISNSITQTSLITVNSTSVPDFSYSISELEATFTNQSIGANSYSWDFGDGEISTSENSIHTYAVDGNYFVNLTVTNECGSTTTQQEIEILTMPSAGFTSSSTIGCSPLTVQFTDQSSANAETRQWSFPGGSPSISTDLNPLVTYSTPGVYGVTLTVVNSLGQNSVDQSELIVINPDPIASFTVSQNGLNVDFTTIASNVTSYQWSFGDGNFSSTANPNHSFSTDGVYSVTLTASNECGSVQSTEIVTIVTSPNASFNASATAFCSPATVQFTDLSSSNTENWLWSFPGGTPSTSTDQNPLIVYNTAGTYTVSLEVSNSAGTDTEVSENLIQVGETPAAAFNSTVSDFTVSFLNLSTNGTSYLWDFGDGNSSTAFNPTHTYIEEGDFQVTLTVMNSCGTSVSSDDFSFFNMPLAGIGSTNSEGCAPYTVSFQDLSTGQITSRLWSFPGGTPATSTEENPSVVYTTQGVYPVSLEVSTPAGTNAITEADYVVVNTDAISDFGFSIDESIVTFDNTSINASGYFWDFGDGNSSTLADPVHEYEEDGTYEVTLTAINECSDVFQTIEIVIATAPVAGFMSSATSGCTPFEINFTNTSSPNAESLLWSFPGGNPSTSMEQNPIVTYETEGVYDVVLEVQNGVGSDTEVQNNIITIDPQPIADFGFSTDELEVVFENESSNGNSYVWDFGDGSESFDENPTHEYQMDGVYNVTLLVTNGCGEISTERELVLITSPTASFTTSTASGCTPFEVTYTNTSTSNASQFVWNFPGGTPSTSTDENPVVVYENPGVYDAVLEVSNAAGMDVFTQTNLVSVEQIPTASFEFEMTDNQVSFQNNSENGNTYFWDFGDGNVSSMENPIHTFEENGDYLVTLTSSNDCGEVSFSTSIEILVVSLPTASFTATNASGCGPLTVQFENESTDNAESFQWTFEGGTPETSTESDPIVVYETPGNFTVNLTVSNSAGSDTYEQMNFVFVDSLPEASFTFETNDLELIISDQSMNATSYFWTFGDGTTSTLENPSYVYNQEGTYELELIATNACGSDTLVSAVSVGQGITAPIASFTSDETNGCSPFEVQFNDQSENNPESWSWSFPGGFPSTSNMQNPIVVYSTPGVYEVSLIAANSAGTNEMMLAEYISVEPTVEAAFEIEDVQGANYTFSNISQNAESYLWDFGDGTNSSEENPVHEFTESGLFNIQLVASNICGTDTVFSEVMITIVSLEDLEKEFSFKVFPNPNKGQFTVSLDGFAETDMQLNVYNVLGQKIWKEEFDFSGSLRKNMNFNYLASGTYFLQINTKEGQLNRKIIIE